MSIFWRRAIYLLVCLILSLGILLGVYQWRSQELISFLFQHKTLNLISPTSAYSRLSISDNIWFPKVASEDISQDKDLPKITAKAAFFVDANTGEVLFQKNSHEKYHIASLIKIMTAIITMEHTELDTELAVSKRAADFEPDKMNLVPGEVLTVSELLSGIFLVSGNDAAEVLAERVTGRREEFISLMNSKALQLGMSNTIFINPTGLEEDNRKQYSSAYDVALMSRYAIKRWPTLISISSQPFVYIPQTKTHQDYTMYSGINLLTSYPGVMGFKTGYTPEAGLTLVTVAKRENKEVIGVLLGSKERRDDAKKLLDYSFKKLGVKVL